MTRSLALATLLLLTSLVVAEPWTTYRANSQRTACADGKDGPTSPRVLWAMKAKEHFIAAPVPYKDRLFVSGVDPLAGPVFYSLDTSPKGDKRIAWVKKSPDLEMPTVSSPAVHDGKLIFGDGMHQTNNSSLYALDVEKGGIAWQFRIEGELVHLEGSPTVAGGKVYLGGGSAGVLCIDPSKLTLDGKEMSSADIAKTIEAKRKDLQAKYEEAKTKGDKFAIPPTDRDLPRASPVIAWQAGKVRWHVDAPVAVVGDRVLAASAYLDKEKTGERTLYCLDAKTGKELWKQDLSINPWGGPSVSGDVVVVTGSTISLDPKSVKGAKGVVAAFDLAKGQPKWKKELPGAAFAAAALGSDIAVVPCTDGRVRAYNLNTGAIRWNYDGGAAFFAPAALSGQTVYVGDVKGVVHAIDLRKGAMKWKLDLASDPEVKAPGMIHAGLVLDGGKLYAATSNLNGDPEHKTTAVVCIGEK